MFPFWKNTWAEMSPRAVGMLEELVSAPEQEPTRAFTKGRLVIRKSARLPADTALFRADPLVLETELE